MKHFIVTSARNFLSLFFRRTSPSKHVMLLYKKPVSSEPEPDITVLIILCRDVKRRKVII